MPFVHTYVVKVFGLMGGHSFFFFLENVSETINASVFPVDPVEKYLQFHKTHEYLMHFYLGIALCICFFGVVSNVTCFLAICFYPKLRRSGNILVGNFVLVNLLLSGLAYPLSILTVYLRGYSSLHYPSRFCQWIFLYYFFIHALCWQECMLALNRFVAIVVPFHYKKISSKKALVTTVCLGYTVPLILNICAGTLGEQPLFASSQPFGGCLYNPRGNVKFQVAHGVLGVYFPMLTVGAAYFVIFLKIFVDRMLKGQRMRALFKRRTATAKMLCAGFLWFCLMYLPQPVLTTFFKELYAANPWSYAGSRWALFLGAGANAVSSIGRKTENSHSTRQLNIDDDMESEGCMVERIDSKNI
jgi:7 transmembrane receptor (rhodopsin family)